MLIEQINAKPYGRLGQMIQLITAKVPCNDEVVVFLLLFLCCFLGGGGIFLVGFLTVLKCCVSGFFVH